MKNHYSFLKQTGLLRAFSTITLIALILSLGLFSCEKQEVVPKNAVTEINPSLEPKGLKLMVNNSNTISVYYNTLSSGTKTIKVSITNADGYIKKYDLSGITATINSDILPKGLYTVCASDFDANGRNMSDECKTIKVD
jgi:hypothetical protein